MPGTLLFFYCGHSPHFQGKAFFSRRYGREDGVDCFIYHGRPSPISWMHSTGIVWHVIPQIPRALEALVLRNSTCSCRQRLP